MRIERELNCKCHKCGKITANNLCNYDLHPKTTQEQITKLIDNIENNSICAECYKSFDEEENRKYREREFYNKVDSEEHKNCTFSNFRDTYKVVPILQELLKLPAGSEKNKNVLLVGKSGTGKTHILHAFWHTAFIKYKMVCEYALLPDVIREYNTRQFADHSNERYLNRFKTVPILLLDEIDKIKSSEADLDIAYRLIDFRTRNNMLTFFACNLSGGSSEIATRIDTLLGTATAERLLDTRKVLIITMGDMSYRKAQGQLELIRR